MKSEVVRNEKLYRKSGLFSERSQKNYIFKYALKYFTFLGTVLILLMLASVVTGWNIASRLVKMLEQEAEISVFFHEEMDEKRFST